jgi:uncharacterized protein (DUF305 family)
VTNHRASSLKRILRSRFLTLSLSAVLAVTATACGSDSASVGDSAQERSSQAAEVAANGVDRAFVSQMVPHHESAVDMAQIATEQAEHEELRGLAEQIIEDQNAEIKTLNRLQGEFERAGVEEGDLGMSDDMAGMNMDSSMLENADPFDREFIDMMIGHHQGAIRMAQTEIADGANSEAQQLAENVIASQAREIEQMNEWREEWFGEPSPAGGVPTE